jgi:ribosome-associated protein
MTNFELKEFEFIELNKLLKVLGLVGTGGESHQRIDNGEVKVNGAVETQRRKKLRVGDKIEFAGETVVIK